MWPQHTTEILLFRDVAHLHTVRFRSDISIDSCCLASLSWKDMWMLNLFGGAVISKSSATEAPSFLYASDSKLSLDLDFWESSLFSFLMHVVITSSIYIYILLS